VKRKKKETRGDRWEKNIWRAYGLTPWMVVEMYAEQGGKCAICTNDLHEKNWVIDHKHVRNYKKLSPEEKRKFVRGLVCIYCNWKVLGQIERAGRVRAVRACRYLGFLAGTSLEREAT